MKGPLLAPCDHATLTDALRAAAQTPLGLTFVDLREQERFVPWAEVLSRARRLAGALRELGVAPQSFVALVLPTSLDFMDAFFGVLLAGAVPVPLYPPVRLGRLEEFHTATARMLVAANVCLVLTNARVRRLLGRAIEAARPRLGCQSVEELLDGSPGAHEEASAPDALALIQFSSGSTVDPKPVALSHHNVLAQCEALRTLMPIRSDTQPTGVTWLPLYHDMGLVGCLLSAAYYPGNLVLIGPEDFLARPSLWLRAISRHEAYVSPAPNFAYGVCAKRVRDEELEGQGLSSWRHALCGAEPVSAPTLRKFAQRFASRGFCAEALMPVYGLSEATLAVTFTPPRALRTLAVNPLPLAAEGRVALADDGARRELVSVGVPIPGVELEIRDAEGLVLPDDVQGRVFVRGPSVMERYLDAPAATFRALREGWLDTGDLGFIHNGELFLTGRSKDLVIIRGANHAPQEFEDCLLDLEGVRTGCVVALGFTPPEAPGEQLLILAERNATAVPELEERIRETLVTRTGVRPHTVVLLAPGTLPRTSSGKLRRAEALRQYLSQTLAAPRPVNLLSLGWQAVRSSLAFVRARRLS